MLVLDGIGWDLALSLRGSWSGDSALKEVRFVGKQGPLRSAWWRKAAANQFPYTSAAEINLLGILPPTEPPKSIYYRKKSLRGSIAQQTKMALRLSVGLTPLVRSYVSQWSGQTRQHTAIKIHSLGRPIVIVSKHSTPPGVPTSRTKCARMAKR
jgi:hypothetical protein